MPEKKKKPYMIMWYTQLSKQDDLMFHKFREWLFQKGFSSSDSKYELLKYCTKLVLYDYADEVIDGYIYSMDELVELIEHHEILRNKFATMLNVLAGKKEEKREEIIDAIKE